VRLMGSIPFDTIDLQVNWHFRLLDPLSDSRELRTKHDLGM
jgi:hypothetical protein